MTAEAPPEAPEATEEPEPDLGDACPVCGRRGRAEGHH